MSPAVEQATYKLQCGPGPVSLFKIDLDQDVEHSQLFDPKPNDVLVFIIRQDQRGNHTFALPPEVKAVTAINSEPGATTTLVFVFDGETASPTSGPLVVF